MTKSTGISLASLDAVAASETPFQFELLDDDGGGTGVFLSVLGSNGSTVRKARNGLVDESNRKAAIRAASARPGKAAEPTPFEESVAFSQRLAAAMLVGWSGIAEEYTPDLGRQLCETNPDAVAQIIEQSNKLGNFTRRSA